MRILVVEDEPMTARILKARLIAMGHEVFLAADGVLAWQMLKQQHFPIVISDWMMPGMDGPSLCSRVRSSGKLQYTYFILLTSKDARADRMDGLRAGADDFLIKPCNSEELAVRLEIGRRILAVQEQLERQNAQLLKLVSTDELTGLANRREFFRVVEANFALSDRQGLPTSLILADIDHFKGLNDAFGHPAGDVALRDFATTLKSNCRCHELIARIGGEEFAVLLPGVAHEISCEIAERLRERVVAKKWPHRPLTASFGVSTSGPGILRVSDLIEQADDALYASKRSGRNRVTHFEERRVLSSLVL